MISICFVCLGNICRSSTAEGIMCQLVEEAGLSGEIAVESAGTASYHVGERPDSRSQATATQRGVALPSVARQFVRADFDRFDYVIAMDANNLSDLRDLGEDAHEPLYLFRSFDSDSPEGSAVPDPYYGGARGFEDVFDICMAACQGLLSHLRHTHKL